jgi:hypothetical protein
LRCETLIVHKSELENLLGTMVAISKPEYFVLGTLDRRTHLRGLAGAASLADVRAHTSDFKSYWKVEVTPRGWYPKNETGDERVG